jgi:purine nucleosidase
MERAMKRRKFLKLTASSVLGAAAREGGSALITPLEARRDPQDEGRSVRLILDGDSVGDDILAIYFAQLHPGISLEGVTTVLGASGSLEQATRVALRSLDIAGGQDVPVYPGAEAPFVPKTEAESKAPVHFEKTLEKFGKRLEGFNAPAEPPARPPENEHAVDYIIRTIRNHPGEITLVATGPWTNVGRALERAPDIAELVKECIVMGGVFHVPGNITPVVEYNVWADPDAARVVFNAGMELIVVGLDVCEHNGVADAMLTRDDLFDLEKGGTEASRDICSRFPIYIDIWREFFGLVGFPMDDVIAVAMAIDKTLCGMSGPLHVDVALEGDLTRGQTIAFEGRQIFSPEFSHPPRSRICRTIDGKRFMKLFKETVSGLG